MMKRSQSDFVAGFLFASPYLFGLLVFAIYPIAMSFYYSFTRYDIFSQPEWVGWDNYIELFSDRFFWTSILNTLYYTLISVPLGMMVALLLALLLNVKVGGQSFFRTIFFLPSITPMIAASLLWLWIFNARFGLLNSVLKPLIDSMNDLLGSNLNTPGWLADPVWSKPALILMSIWGVGGTMVLYLAALQDVPQTLYEVAELDGANPLRKFLSVTLPMISPVLFFTFVMGLIAAFQVFLQAYVMTAGGPGDSTLFYCLYLFNNGFLYFRLGYASAMAWILFIMVILVTIFVFKTSGRYVYYEGESS
jgi:multiple sugar transport system permease protein